MQLKNYEIVWTNVSYIFIPTHVDSFKKEKFIKAEILK